MRRDKYGIIIQTDKDKPDYADAGDSAFSTGLMAFCGSLEDIQLMPLFITEDYQLVRHPFQSANTGTHPHNDPRSVSRDQVIAFFAGLKWCVDENVKKACLKYAKGWRVNRDILGPAHKYYLYKLAGVEPSTTLEFFAELHQMCSIVWDCYIRPSTEKNQSIVMNSVFGLTWITLLCRYHPNIFINVSDYFGGWRDKKEIGDALNQAVLKRILSGNK